jgi:hypothetical protein
VLKGEIKALATKIFIKKHLNVRCAPKTTFFTDGFIGEVGEGDLAAIEDVVDGSLEPRLQGCQIFLGTTYRKLGKFARRQEIYQMSIKYTNMAENGPNGHKIYQNGRKMDQMAIKYSNI